jgi:hypothetical protein
MPVLLDHQDHARLVETFAREAPRLLAREPLTADLAARVAALAQLSEEPFTLAVIGQMRAGKSTLLNALVGKDLALTGVNETTATVNWFKYGTGTRCSTFRAHFREKPPEDFPLDEISNWAGDSGRAMQTRYLEFFADADFLREIFIVDTPGTRSVLAAHEAATQEFLAEKREHETLFHGGAADAILYVLPPVARETDDELLRSFERTTRLPGSSPYNSLAVIHKWETLEGADPLAEAQRKTGRVAAQLREQVSDVLPVSGPLALCVARLPFTWWEKAALLLQASVPVGIERLIARGEEAFVQREITGASPAADRRALRDESHLPWPCLRALLRQAAAREVADATALRELAREMAGTDALLALLRERFFARARLIKSFSLVSRALDPCNIALARLRERSSELRRLINEAALARACIGQPVRVELAPAERFIGGALTMFNAEAARLATFQRELEEHVRTVLETYEQLNEDAECLRLLDEGLARFPAAERAEARRILGAHGTTLGERCAGANGSALADWLAERLDAWQSRNGRVAERVAERINDLLDHLETTTT